MQGIEESIEKTRRNLEEAESVSRTSIDGKLSELEKRLEELELEVFSSEERGRSLSDQVEAIRSEIEALESSSSEQRLNQLEDELMNLKQSIDERPKEEGDVEELWDALDNEFYELEKRIYEDETELEELRADVARISEILREVVSQQFE